MSKHTRTDIAMVEDKPDNTSASGWSESKEDSNVHDNRKPSQLLQSRTHAFASKRDEALTKIQLSYQAGLKHYQENNLELAEQEFVKVLKPVLSKPLMKDLYVGVDDCKRELLDAMYHLGKIYLARDVYPEHHAKAAGIFHYCERFSKEHSVKLHHDNGKEINFLRDAYLTEEQFIASLNESINASKHSDSDAIFMEDQYLQYQQEIDGFKYSLERIRLEVEQRLVQINTLTIERIADRANAVEALYKDCTKFFVNNGADKDDKPGVIQKLLQSCFSKLGIPPEGCEYSIIGLGSLAGGKMTPWSDLEFAVLINEDRAEYKEYFRNLIKLMHIKVVNLGETPLRSLGLEALNNFRTANEQDDWFWDDVTSNGFSFDGPDWHACKTPLGRQGGYKAIKKIKLENDTEEISVIDKSDYELILTPRQMAAFQKEQQIRAAQAETFPEKSANSDASYMDDISINANTGASEDTSKDSWFKSDMHLVQSLRSVILIGGNQTLLDNYRQELRFAEDPQMIRNRVLEKLKEDLASFSLKLGDEEEGKLIDVKKDIFRIGDRIIEDLANYYGIEADEDQPGLTAWEILDKMASVIEGNQESILGREGAQHLKEALSVATELRLATYSHNKGQSETMSTYEPAVNHLSEAERYHLLQDTFYVQDTPILHHFYYVMLRVQHLMHEFCNQQHYRVQRMLLSTDLLFDDSNYNKGMVHARFLEYDRALQLMEAAQEEQPANLVLLSNLFHLYSKMGVIEKAVKIAKEMLRLNENEYKDYPNHPFIAASYDNLGIAYDAQGNHEQAIECFGKALEIQIKTHGYSPNHPSVAANYDNLGSTYFAKGDYDNAIEHYSEALDIRIKVYVHSPNHLEIASSYNNLGAVYDTQGNYERAIDYYNKSLSLKIKVYVHSPNHTDFAGIYNNLGTAYGSKGDYERAIEYHEKALDIQVKIYEHSPNNPFIAASYNNLGTAHFKKKDYDKAIEYHSKALDIQVKIYVNNLNHLTIATSYNNLGLAYACSGCDDKSLASFKEALSISRNFFQEDHPEVGIKLFFVRMLEKKLLQQSDAKVNEVAEIINLNVVERIIIDQFKKQWVDKKKSSFDFCKLNDDIIVKISVIFEKELTDSFVRHYCKEKLYIEENDIMHDTNKVYSISLNKKNINVLLAKLNHPKFQLKQEVVDIASEESIKEVDLDNILNEVAEAMLSRVEEIKDQNLVLVTENDLDMILEEVSNIIFTDSSLLGNLNT